MNELKLSETSESSEEKLKEEEIKPTKEVKKEEFKLHHSEAEVAEKLFSIPQVEVPDQLKSMWGWASSVAHKVEKQVETTFETVKKSSNQIIQELEKVTPEDSSTEPMPPKISKYSTALPWKRLKSKEMEQRVFELSTNKSTFLEEISSYKTSKRELNTDELSNICDYLLRNDTNLREIKALIVPSEITEEVFWKRYKFHLSLLLTSYENSDNKDDQLIEKSLNFDADRANNVNTDLDMGKEYEMFNEEELLANVSDIDSDEFEEDDFEKRLSEKLKV